MKLRRLLSPGRGLTGSRREQPSDVLEDDDERALQAVDPPDGGYGWVCVACCFFINGFTWGVVAVLSPLIHEEPWLTISSHTESSYPTISPVPPFQGQSLQTSPLLGVSTLVLPCSLPLW